ncbi:MAG: ComF family protein, partial [Clostridia bacterium]|nr:ComF family protein [Clostridia bacterium]
DQSEEIAAILALQLHIPLERLFGRRHGEEQKMLNHAQRQENAEDSLILIRQPAENGKYLLLDDIITSGATMEAAARQLRFAGASALFPVAAARSMPKSRKNEEEMIENTEI